MIELPVTVHFASAGQPDSAEKLRFERWGRYRFGTAEDNEVQLQAEGLSRRHFSVDVAAEGVTLIDEDSTNGTTVGGEKIGSHRLEDKDHWEVPGYEFGIEIKAAMPQATRRQLLTRVADTSAADAATLLEGIEFPDNVFGDSLQVDLERVRASGLPVREVQYAAVGGGIGSFVWVDHLRCYGVPTSDIVAIGMDPVPYGNYARYCKNSQIPDHERLRSNSLSTPDNIWGFPGYASRESFRGLGRGRIGDLRYIFQVFGEPAVAESYTPKAGNVFRSMDREARRIGWNEMFVQARAVAMRKTTDGRYVIGIRLMSGGESVDFPESFVVATHVQLATGYPATRFVRDLQDFITRHPEQRHLVMNAYEQHDQVYERAEASGEDEFFVVRGRGIVASRIIQRLSEARKKNPKIKIIHSIRTPLRDTDGAQYKRTRRFARGNVEIQPFNWPKSCWGGGYRSYYEAADDMERGFLLGRLGGTTTAERSDWIDIMERGGEQGWYRPVFGNISSLKPLDGDKLEVTIETHEGNRETIRGDHLIDCTGLIADIKLSRFLGDLVDTYGLERNHAWRGDDPRRMEKGPETGIRVNPHFEIEGLRNGQGRVYAAGTITTGGPYLAVDSFLGLQYSALRSVDDLSDARAPGLSRFGPLTSFGQWMKWCRGARP